MSEAQAPWEVISNIANSWTSAQIVWIFITIILVFVLHWISTRRRKKIPASWIRALFWLISLVGWTFVMHTVMWAKIDPSGIVGTISLILSAALSLIGILLVFRISKIGSEGREFWSKIISGVISAIIVFGILAFAGIDQNGTAMAIGMGGLLGFFIGQLYYNVTNMYNDHSKLKAEQEKWTPPPP